MLRAGELVLGSRLSMISSYGTTPDRPILPTPGARLPPVLTHPPPAAPAPRPDRNGAADARCRRYRSGPTAGGGACGSHATDADDLPLRCGGVMWGSQRGFRF